MYSSVSSLAPISALCSCQVCPLTELLLLTQPTHFTNYRKCRLHHAVYLLPLLYSSTTQSPHQALLPPSAEKIIQKQNQVSCLARSTLSPPLLSPSRGPRSMGRSRAGCSATPSSWCTRREQNISICACVHVYVHGWPSLSTTPELKKGAMRGVVIYGPVQLCWLG